MTQEITPSQISQTVWPWRQPTPSRAGLSWGKILAQALIPAVVGGIFLAFKKTLPAYILFGVAGLLVLLGLFAPRVFSAIGRVAALVGKGVGVGLSYLLLVPFYYLIFTPVRLLQCATGRDSLCRRFPSNEPTYWLPRPPVTTDQYRKQH